ncbi:Parvalbumin [Trema orientale]|uniref:Parvalbumin n=1 Tax=Trema orientale TaxID=63057 RepID=A0A2P5E6X7_TREOI|nr:Parvalbumin [Trema orientale]
MALPPPLKAPLFRPHLRGAKNMAKAVVYALLAAAFVLLVILGPSNNRSRDHLGLHRRLGNRLRAPAFDPLVAKIERYAEEKGSKEGGNDVADQVAGANRFFNDEGVLNITLRLIVLFPLLDKAPEDGVVSSSELNSWIRDMAVERLNYRTRRELASHDENGDGAISFREYLPQFSDEDIGRETDVDKRDYGIGTEKNGMKHGEAGWWKQQFVNADVDNNGTLSFDELRKRMDYDKDGKLNFMEFSDHAYEIYKNYIEYETAGVQVVSSAEEKFAELDVNKDKFLALEELIPILSYLNPGELSYAKYYANYLIQEADDNKDGKLTLDEMLNHEYVFYSTVYDDTQDDFEENFHDEL